MARHALHARRLAAFEHVAGCGPLQSLGSATCLLPATPHSCSNHLACLVPACSYQAGGFETAAGFEAATGFEAAAAPAPAAEFAAAPAPADFSAGY